MISDTRSLDVAKFGIYLGRFVAGDTWRINRTYSNTANAGTISTIYWTVKTDPTLPDASAIFQRVITSGLTAAGQITDANAADGSIALNIIALKTQTTLLTPGQEYYYDVQGVTSTGAVYTFETGTIVPQQGVTTASS